MSRPFGDPWSNFVHGWHKVASAARTAELTARTQRAVSSALADLYARFPPKRR